MEYQGKEVDLEDYESNNEGQKGSKNKEAL